jgi:putative heme iron utilization protein
MPSTSGRDLRSLLESQSIAALGTLHRGEPYVSMVPFALDDEGPHFLIHVSALAPHTKDMRESARVSLLIVAPDAAAPSPQARARATVQGDAEALAHDSPQYARAKTTYLARFPQAVDIFELPDFSIFRIRPVSVRFIGGFAQAASLVGDAMTRALRGA